MKQSTAINQLLQGPRLDDRESDELLERPLSGPRRRIRVTTALPVKDLPTLAPRGTPPAGFDPILRPRSSQDVVTHLVRRQPRRSSVPRPLAVAALSLGVIAAGAAGYRVFHSRSAPAAIAAVAPVAPTVSPIGPAAPAPSYVDIQLASEPAGATVTLIDDGHALLLGTTPLSASLDPSRAHDLVFALDGRTPRTAHVDAHATADVSVRLPRSARKHHR